MKKKLVCILTVALCICAMGLSACFFGGGDKVAEVTYHLNGGYRNNNPEWTEDYDVTVPAENIGSFKPISVKRDTWLFDGWYTDAECNDLLTDERFVELADAGRKIELYAKWTDQITVTKYNFTEYFKVSSSWNGGLNIGSAAIDFEFEPKMAFDPAESAASVEIDVTPVLTNAGSTVWSGETQRIYLSSADDYFYSGRKAVGSSAAGVQFQIGAKTLDWELVTPSFTVRLLHRVPIAVRLDCGDGVCEKDEIVVTGGDTLAKNELPVPTKNGYRFMGWYLDADFETAYADKMITAARTLYAKFTKEITVTFHTDGGAEKPARTYLTGEFISVSDEQRTGYKFFGWYTDANFDGDKFTSQFAGDRDIELYARWEHIRTVTFVTGGGSEKAAVEVADTEIPVLGDDPTKNGREFVGWYEDAAFEHEYQPQPVSGDFTLYARWAVRTQLSGWTVDRLREYVDIEVTSEYTTVTENGLIYNVRQVTVSASIKQEYRRYGFVLSGKLGIDFSDDKGADLGNCLFGNMTLSTLNDRFSFTDVYTVKAGVGAYDATVLSLGILSNYGYIDVPEDVAE